MFVYPSSVENEIPIRSNAPSGRWPSTVKAGIPRSRMSDSRSGQTL